MSLSVPTILSHGFSIQRSKVLRQICATNAHLHKLELVKSLKGLAKLMCSLYRGFVFSRFFFIYFTATGLKKMVGSTNDFFI